MKPGLLLLDEPTANLDPEGVVEVHDAVKKVIEAPDRPWLWSNIISMYGSIWSIA